MSISVRPTRPLPAWRATVIGAVGVLAVAIGAAAGSFLLSARDGAVGAGASYVPAGAPFYVEMRLEPSTTQDAALRELLGRFPPIEGVDLDRPLYAQLTERIDEMLAAEGAEVSWAEDVAPWFDGHLAIALTEFDASAMAMPVDPMAMPEVPPAVLLLGITDRAAAEAAIARLLAEAGEAAPAFTETQHAGSTIHSSDTGAYALTDDQLVIGSDADAITSALDTHAAGSGSLAEVAEMARLVEALPSDWLAFMSFDMTEIVAASFEMAEEQDPGMTAALRSLMEDQPLRGAMALSAAGDRFAMDTASDAPSGAFSVENADRGLADEVPGDVLYFADGGNIGTALSAVIGPIKEAALSTPEGEEQVRMAEAALGADLEEVVSWIDDGAVAVGYDGTAPYGGLLLVPSDMDAAERRLGQLATFASLGAMDPSSGIGVDTSEVAGVTVTTITWEDPGMGAEMLPVPTGVVIEYALTDDRAVIGVGDTFVRRILELTGTDSLAGQPRFAEAIAELGGETNAGMAWLDLAGTRTALESALSGLMAEGGGQETYEIEVLPWLEPFDRLVSVSRLDGDIVLQRAALLLD